jgi:hypothetical protein
MERVVLFKKVMPMAMENLSITQHRDTLQYTHTQGGSHKPKVRQFDVDDFVYLQQQPNDTLDISFGHTILRIKAIMPLGVLELQGTNRCIIRDHSKNYAPYHLPNLDPTIIMFSYSTLISTQTMPHFSRLRSGGGYMKISSQPPIVHYICVCVCVCVCVHLFLID